MMEEPEDRPRQWPDNLEAQSLVIAALLRHLLSSGVCRSDVCVDQFLPTIRQAGYPGAFDADGLFLDLIAWLRDEGIIRVENIVGTSKGDSLFCGCVLTGYGMNLLKTQTNILGGKSPAEVIMNPEVDRNATAGQLVKFGGLIGGIIGGFVKSAS